MHVQVDAPLVFNTKNRAASALPAPVQEAQNLRMEDSPVRQVNLDPVIESPLPDKKAKTGKPQKDQQERRGFLHKVKGFFGGMFK